jgi:23S rRNA (pseudouridine1915-N3)-methyltransferase
VKILVVAVGKVKEKPVRAAIDEYVARIARYTKVQELELPDEDEASVAARFAKAIPDRARTIALEVDGQRVTSPGLAKLVADAQNRSVPALVFLIGGSYGLPKATSAGADVRLSLSDLTLPHRLARLVLAEQIYRAFTILRGEPYSH